MQFTLLSVRARMLWAALAGALVSALAFTMLPAQAAAPAPGATVLTRDICARAALRSSGLSAADRAWATSCVHVFDAGAGTPGPTASTSASATPSVSPSVSASPTSVPTSASASPSSSPSASPSTSPTSVPPVADGRQITAANTGYLHWPGGCTDATLTVYAGRMAASTLIAAGTTTCVWLKAGVTVDVPVTLTAAKIDTIVRSDGPRLQLDWSTVDGHGDGTFAIGGHNVGAYRSNIGGASDGVRFEQMDLVEDYIRTVSTSPDDHNDGVQFFQAAVGGSIRRCNINSRPVNLPASDGIYGTAAVFAADSSMGELVLRDNFLGGGGYTLRLHEAMTYRVTGNVIDAGSWLYGPVSTSNAVPGAFLEWSGNMLSDGTPITGP